MYFHNGPYHKTLVSLVALFFLLMPIDSQAAAINNCLECHQKYIDDQYSKSFIHKPFLQKKCQSCHSPDWVDTAAASDGEAIFPQKIKHIGTVATPALVHLFVIPAESAPQIIFLEARNASTNSYKTKLRIPSFESLQPLSSDATPPAIHNIEVAEVERNNSGRAIIKWKTDKHSNSTIFYGTSEPDKHVKMADCFMSEHSIELTNLLPDRTYNFRIMAEDIYGNTRESALHSFTTDKSFKMGEKELDKSTSVPMRLESEIFKSEDNYILRLKANQPVSMEISTFDLASFTLLRKMSDKAPANHPALKSIYETNLLACENCHLAPNDVFPHEVHFRARLGSNIPEDYPRLPNGQMSCITCHYPHASNNQFHLRKPSDRTLCVGCHKRSFRE